MKCLEYWALIPPNLPKQSNSDNEITVIMDSKHLDHMALIKLTDNDQLIFGNDYYNQLRCQEVDYKVTDEEADLAVIQMTQEFLLESLQNSISTKKFDPVLYPSEKTESLVRLKSHCLLYTYYQ